MANATSDAVPYSPTRTAPASLIDEASKGLDNVAVGRVKSTRKTLLKIKHCVAAHNAASTGTKSAVLK